MWHLLPLFNICNLCTEKRQFSLFSFPQFKCALSRSIRVGLMGNRWPFRAGFELLSVVIRSDGLVCDYCKSVFNFSLCFTL